jgi:transposase
MELSKEHYRSYIYIELKRRRKPSEIYQQLQETDLNVPSQSTVFEWCRRFKEGRDSLNDDMRPGRPCSSSTPENVNIIQHLVQLEPRTSLRELAESTGMTKDVVRRILTMHLGLRKVCSTWIPHHLSEQNKRERILCAKEIIKLFHNHTIEYLLSHWATEDESWFLHETALTKQQNMAWLQPTQKKPTVIRPQLTNKKTMLLVAFTGDQKVNVENADPGETINAERYIEFVRSTGEKWRHLRRTPIKLSELIWQHDNARSHVARETMTFFEGRNVTLLKQSPYSPDLNQCDRWIFKTLKNLFRGLRFSSGDEVKAQAVQSLRALPVDKFEMELQSLFEHCKRVVSVQGDYVV